MRNFRNFALKRQALLSGFTVLLVVVFQIASFAQAKRIVVIKADGLSYDHIERFVAERDTATGESLLPAIKRVFYDNGARLQNFYVRGISLSAPSWSLLDTGRRLQIKGNVEYDRYTLRTYDYLNFLPYYVEYLHSQHVDKTGVEILDSLGIPLLFDAFDYQQRYQSYQLFQRATRWMTMLNAPKSLFADKSLRDLAGEWAGGVDFRSTITNQYERDVIALLNDPNIKYLDIFTPVFDHAAHLHRDRPTLLAAVQNIDAMIGRVWQAIEQSPLKDETVLVLVSDHSVNTDERIYSQGYNLVSLLGSAAGGGHHVVTNRYPMSAYHFKSFNPVTSIVVTESRESVYLQGLASKYPTALADLDGNERASIHFRNSDLNALHILLIQLQGKKLTPDQQAAATKSLFQILERNRPCWSKTLAELKEELSALGRYIDRQTRVQRLQPKNFSDTDEAAGLDKEARRISAKLAQARRDDADYFAYQRTLDNLLALKPETFNPSKLKIEDVIAPRAMGEPNSVYQLQNYAAGLSPPLTVNYFSLLLNQKVRNNVQAGVDSYPVDFVAVKIPREDIAVALNPGEQPDQDAIWLYAGETRQALILPRKSKIGELWLKYLPVAELRQNESGGIRFRRIDWQPKLPLQIWEDQQLNVVGNRSDWLNQWHSELDWLCVLHQTKYANGLIGLHEQLAAHEPPLGKDDSPEGKLLRRFWLRQRRLTEADLLVFANDHWNFNVRDFNPGGNHGSLLRVSTHSTLMLAGGARTSIPKALLIEEPYDSLSFVPTILALMGNSSSVDIQQRQFQWFPGRVIRELIPSMN